MNKMFLVKPTIQWTTIAWIDKSIIFSGFKNGQNKCILDGDCAQGEECCDDVCMPWILCKTKSKLPIQSTIIFWIDKSITFAFAGIKNEQNKCILDGDCAQNEACCDDVCMPWILCD